MTSNQAQLNRETQAAWDTKAAFWDTLMGDEGNAFQYHLVHPAAERLLNVQPGMRVLDAACGTGVFSRRLAALGATVTAFDFSAGMLERARARETANITYHEIDATDENAILALGEAGFDAAVCNMGLMDMVTIEPLMRAIARMVKPGGPFVFTVLHPAFNSADVRLMAERELSADKLIDRNGVFVWSYLSREPFKGVGAPGEPVPHYYFHRPLHELLGITFHAGYVVDGMEEPAFKGELESPNPLSWGNMPQIPPVLAVRLRRV